MFIEIEIEICIFVGVMIHHLSIAHSLYRNIINCFISHLIRDPFMVRSAHAIFEVTCPLGTGKVSLLKTPNQFKTINGSHS